MVNVLVIGSNGFLGRAIATAANLEGMSVHGASRSHLPATDAIHCHVADRNAPATIKTIVIDNRIDVVVDVLAMTLNATQPLLEALDGYVAHYVMLSSSDVYRNYELMHRTASTTAQKEKPRMESADEASPLRRSRYPYRGQTPRAAADPEQWLDDYEKIAIEASVRRLGTNWTILRLPMVYGPGDKQRRFRWAIAHMLRSNKPLILPKPWASWVTTYGYIDNVAAGIVSAIGNERARCETFNIGEEEPVASLIWANRIANTLGWNRGIEVTDDNTSRFAQSLQSMDLSVPFLIDSMRIREYLNFAEPVSIADGLRKTAADEKQRG